MSSQKTFNFFSEANHLAEQSSMDYRLGAVLVKSGTIIAKGTNSNRSRISSNPLNIPQNTHSIHAEIAAVLNYLSTRSTSIAGLNVHRPKQDEKKQKLRLRQ